MTAPSSPAPELFAANRETAAQERSGIGHAFPPSAGSPRAIAPETPRDPVFRRQIRFGQSFFAVSQSISSYRPDYATLCAGSCPLCTKKDPASGAPDAKTSYDTMPDTGSMYSISDWYAPVNDHMGISWELSQIGGVYWTYRKPKSPESSRDSLRGNVCDRG